MRIDGKYQRFSEAEDQIIRDHYFTMGAAKLSRILLTNRFPQRIASRANHLGIYFDKSLIGKRASNMEDLGHMIGIETPFVAYMLGFLWADGYVGRNTHYVRLKIVDVDFQDIKDRWLATAKSWIYRTYDDQNPNHRLQAIVGINHIEFHDFLVQNGYIFKSGESASFILSSIPKAYHNYWWRGFFDGDGGFTVSGMTRRITLTSTYDQNWDFFKSLATELDIAYTCQRRQSKCSNSNIFIESEACIMKFFRYIYAGESFGLKRKLKRYQDYIQYKLDIRPDKTSKYRGVSLRRGLWMMQIYRGRPYRRSFTEEIDAAIEYDRMALQLFGNKAVLNFPRA